MIFLVVFCASYLYLLIIGIGLYVLLFLSKKQKKSIATLSIIVFPLAYLLSKLLGALITSPRPFVSQQITPLIHSSTDNGFPSDHTLLSITIALLIFQYNRTIGNILIFLTLCVGIARVLALVHHPVDILGSIAIAAISVYGTKIFLTHWKNYKK